MVKEVADIKTSDQLNLPVPEVDYKTIVIIPTEEQKEYVADPGNVQNRSEMAVWILPLIIC